MSDAYHRFAERTAREFDELERERKEYAEFDNRMDDYRRRHGLIKDPEPTPEITAKEKRIRESAEWREWFNERFDARIEQCLNDPSQSDLLNKIFSEVISLLREDIDAVGAEVTKLKSVVKGEVTPLIRKAKDDAA